MSRPIKTKPVARKRPSTARQRPVRAAKGAAKAGADKRPSVNGASARTSRGPERRIADRAPVMVLEVRGKSYDKIFVGYAENISRSGLFLSAANPPAVGSTFPVEFVLPDNRTLVQCTCRVVWQHRYTTSGRPSVGVGVEFLDLDTLKRALIDQWVKRKLGAGRPSVARSNGASKVRR
ncbi:MAG: PilZ domain-containing protein [Nitrospirota bacterium]